jgi:hypothetical protein
VVLGPVLLRNEACIVQLVEVLVVGEAHRERADGPARALRHEGRQRGRVDSAGQERADRDVRHQASLYGFAEEAPHARRGPRQGLLARHRGDLGGLGAHPGKRVPVARRPSAPGLVHDEVVAGGELVDAAEHRERRRRREEAQVVVDGKVLDVARDLGVSQERLDLAREQKRSRGPREVKRLDPDAVAREEEPPRPRIPDPDPEHALEPVEDGRAPLLEAVNDDFRVGVVRPEPVSEGGQLHPEFLVVVDLAVEDDRDRPVLVEHGLVGGGREVDDREPPEAEADAPVGRRPEALAIRAAMDHRVPHARQEPGIHLPA